MNFREELTKIRQKRRKEDNKRRQFGEHIEHILKQILQYYKNQDNISLFYPKEINFRIDEKNNIIVRIIDLDDEKGNYDHIISYDYIQSKIEAKNILLLLCSTFKINSYRIMYGKTVEKDEEFSVLID